eukprot:9531892-Lingulodinium_polyedra.AAC.1
MAPSSGAPAGKRPPGEGVCRSIEAPREPAHEVGQVHPVAACQQRFLSPGQPAQLGSPHRGRRPVASQAIAPAGVVGRVREA